MNGSTVCKTLAAALGATLLLGQGMQAQAQIPESSGGGFNAREVAASDNAYRLRSRMEAALAQNSGWAKVVNLAMTPGRDDTHQLCGVAVTGDGHYSLFHVTDSLRPEGSLSLTPIRGSLNGLAVAHNEVYAQCGGYGRAVFIIEGYRILD